MDSLGESRSFHEKDLAGIPRSKLGSIRPLGQVRDSNTLYPSDASAPSQLLKGPPQKKHPFMES